MNRFPPGNALLCILTLRCNLGCVYCYQRRRDARAMAPEVLDAAVDRLFAGPAARPDLLLSGGEPLLEPDLVRRALGHRARFAAAGRRLEVTLLTNGTRVNDSILEEAASGNLRLQISLDGPAAVRRQHGRDPSRAPDRLLERLRALPRSVRRTQVTVAATVTPASVPRLAETFAHLSKRSGVRVTLAAALADFPGWRREDEPALVAELARAMGVAPRGGAAGVVRRVLTPFGAPGPPEDCGALTGSCPVVDVDGSVHPCAFLADDHTVVESAGGRSGSPSSPPLHIDDPDLGERYAARVRELSRGPVLGRSPRRRSSYARCDRCDYRAECRVCPAAGRVAHPAGDPDRVPDFACAFQRALLDLTQERAARGRRDLESLGRVLVAARRIDSRKGQ